MVNGSNSFNEDRPYVRYNKSEPTPSPFSTFTCRSHGSWKDERRGRFGDDNDYNLTAITSYTSPISEIPRLSCIQRSSQNHRKLRF